MKKKKEYKIGDQETKDEKIMWLWPKKITSKVKVPEA